MECEKCQDKGFNEQEHGLIMMACDCEKGKEIKAEITGEKRGVEETDETLIEVAAEANALMPRLEGEIDRPKYLILPHYAGDDRPLEERVEEARKIIEGTSNDSSSGIESDNQPVRSPDTGEPRKPRKRKKSKVA